MSQEEQDIWQSRPTSRQLSWYLFFRILFITIFLGGTIAYQFAVGDAPRIPSLPFLYLLTGVSYVVALISALVLPKVKNQVVFTQCQIAWDLLFCFLLVFATGAKQSPFSFVYIFVIISASVFLSRKEVVIVASASIILYGSLVDLQFYNKLPHWRGWDAFPPLQSGEAFYAVFIHVVAFLLTALLSGTLSERWRRSELALQEQQIDYRELKSLNRAILSNINSGLMIVNPQGRIRSFNFAASQITGYRLEEVYNREVSEIFPELKIFQRKDFNLLSRAEATVSDNFGHQLVLGYATNVVKDSSGEDFGLLVTFQDLTQIKEMEAQLKRADRLAAVGRLSAALAHEIRNPLAAISGSVQLMLEGRDLSGEDRRLMGIVIKEADRLSNLLTEFLTYARPKRPEKMDCNLSLLLDDLIEMAKSDQRFKDVLICRDYPDDLTMAVDRDQFRQALWNLMINSAEALQGNKGRIWLGLDPSSRTLYLSDDGPGIPADMRDRVFEPFFTTKEKGTGLGLATVHSIIEAHGGQIELMERADGGTRFSLKFPA